MGKVVCVTSTQTRGANADLYLSRTWCYSLPLFLQRRGGGVV